jgi:prepilin-type N-terminal cleavage/methylation domain-containing protein
LREEQTMLGKLKDSRGFTFVELLMVFVVLGILAQIALVFMLDIRSRAYDTTALADGRNLITTVRNNFVNLDDVDYTKTDGSDIGIETTAGQPRTPVFTLSPGVGITFDPGSKSTGKPDDPDDPNYFEASLYHTAGTSDGSTDSGKREFYYLADEFSDSYILATF